MVGDTNLKQETRQFFEGAKQGLAIWRQATANLDLYLARRFTFFHFVDLDENRMSDVFAYLLNPDETHGQGELFLREFLSDVPLEWLPESGWSRVSIGREVITSRIENWNRRIDIEIAFQIADSWVAIAVENKPWAGDQDQQLSDYARHLEKMYKGRFKLIYLTPNGEKPSGASIASEERKKREDAKQLDYASIRDWASDNGWLKRAEDEVKAERVRWFVSDLRKALIESLPAQEE